MKLINLIVNFFKKKIKVSTDLIDAVVKDVYYKINETDILDFNGVFENDFFKNTPHPLIFTKISWHIIERLESLMDGPFEKQLLSRIIHQSESIFYYSKLCVDTKILVKTRIWSISPHKRGTKIRIRFDYYNEKILLATEYSGGLLFGVKCQGKPRLKGSVPETLRLSEPVPLWQTTFMVSEKLPYEYAGKARIDAPIHTNHDYAVSLGLKDVLLQGTCLFALAINTLLKNEQVTDTIAIKEISAKFVGMVYPQSMVTIRLLNREGGKLFFDILDETKKAALKGGQIFIE